MAPMIDMVFLLLVFFMCVSSLSQAQRRTPVELPDSTESKVPDDLKDRAMVTVASSGDVYLGTEVVDMTDLEKRLHDELAKRPRLRLQVRAARDVPFSDIKKVLRTCAGAGVAEVIYATHQAD